MQFKFGKQQLEITPETDLVAIITGELKGSAAEELGRDKPDMRAAAIRDFVEHNVYEAAMMTAHLTGEAIGHLLEDPQMTATDYLEKLEVILGPLEAPTRFIAVDFIPMPTVTAPTIGVKLARILGTLMTIKEAIAHGTIEAFRESMDINLFTEAKNSLRALKLDSAKGRIVVAEGERLLLRLREQWAQRAQAAEGDQALNVKIGMQKALVEALTEKLDKYLAIYAEDKGGPLDDVETGMGVFDLFAQGLKIADDSDFTKMEVWETVVEVLESMPPAFFADPGFKFLLIYLLYQAASHLNKRDQEQQATKTVHVVVPMSELTPELREMAQKIAEKVAGGPVELVEESSS